MTAKLPREAESFRTIVALYARHGRHCRTALLMFPQGVPDYLQSACDAARAKVSKEQAA